MRITWGVKLAAAFTAAALMLGGPGLPGAWAVESGTAMTVEEMAATEKQYTDAVWEATNWLFVDFETQQLNDLTDALNNLTLYLQQTMYTVDWELLTNCLMYAESTLDVGEDDVKLDPEKEAAYQEAKTAFESAKQARNTIILKENEDWYNEKIANGELQVLTRDEMNQMEPMTRPVYPLPNGNDFAVPAPPSMDNFQKTVTYTGFIDVLPTD